MRRMQLSRCAGFTGALSQPAGRRAGLASFSSQPPPAESPTTTDSPNPDTSADPSSPAGPASPTDSSPISPSPQPSARPPPLPVSSLLKQQSIGAYWDTAPPTHSNLRFARRFFNTHPPSFLFSVGRADELPARSAVPEVTFLGRSNVGKSSLVNALLGGGGGGGAAAAAGAGRGQEKKSRKPGARATALRQAEGARVSSRPGKTQMLNVFGVGVKGGVERREVTLPNGRVKNVWEKWVGSPEGAPVPKLSGLVLVDTPGYGFGSREQWGDEIVKYLTTRKQLRRAFVLINAEHGLLQTDEAILEMLRVNGVSHQIILTKADSFIKPPARSYARVEEQVRQLAERAGSLKPLIQPANAIGGIALGEVLPCSMEVSHDQLSTHPLGVEGIRWAILKAAGWS